MELILPLETALKELMRRKAELDAMVGSIQQAEKALNDDIQKFLSEHLNIKNGDKFSMLDLIEKARLR